jgi:putative SOS response-associated peptidase YedK
MPDLFRERLLLMVGPHESWHSEPGYWLRTFTIITTGANRLIAPFNYRMPVILEERAAEDWMKNLGERDPLRMKSLFVPAPVGLNIKMCQRKKLRREICSLAWT